jgi:hypothetical protein
MHFSENGEISRNSYLSFSVFTGSFMLKVAVHSCYKWIYNISRPFYLSLKYLYPKRELWEKLQC